MSWQWPDPDYLASIAGRECLTYSVRVGNRGGYESFVESPTAAGTWIFRSGVTYGDNAKERALQHAQAWARAHNLIPIDYPYKFETKDLRKVHDRDPKTGRYKQPKEKGQS